MIDKVTSQLAAVPFTPDQIGVPNSPAVGLDGGLQTILSIVYMVIGAASVVYLVIGAVKYTVSGGDASGIKSARETITYAIIGLIVALLAFGAVNFLTSKAGGL